MPRVRLVCALFALFALLETEMWIVWLVKWGGLIVAIVALLSILFVEAFAPVPEATTQPSQIIVLALGLILALVGVILEKRSEKS